MSGWLFLGLTTLVCAGVFANGIRFARMTRNPFAGKSIGGFAVEGAHLPVRQVRLIGRLQMIVAPLFWLLVVALSFGLFGPVHGIQIIRM